MKIFSVHVAPGQKYASEIPVFVREGFSIPAFLLTFLWTLYHRLWFWSVVILAACLTIGKLGQEFLHPISVMTLQLALQCLVGMFAHDWQRRKLARSGYIISDIATGETLLGAQQRYFERYLAAAPRAA